MPFETWLAFAAASTIMLAIPGPTILLVVSYAIGHGRVVWAHPNGWGTDKGVIIIRHTFADGSAVLSFYGHMDPESVTLRAGECVVRGQHIANIGQPRTPPRREAGE